MLVSQKSHYGLRAVFELAKRQGQGPVKIARVAEAQDIPPRFLEVILHNLKQAGLVESRRGMEGGYLLAIAPEALTVGEVIGCLQGPMNLAESSEKKESKGATGQVQHPVFSSLWQEVEEAICVIYQRTTFKALVDREKDLDGNYIASYTI
jgi:Rrf2 family protein